MKKYLLLLLCFYSVITFAAPTLPIALHLTSLKSLMPTERGGDELYITVTVYPSQGRPSHHHVPEYPMHWLAKNINKINNLEMWGGNLAPGQSVKIVLSLIEERELPFKSDDLVGTMDVEIKNDNGKLVSTWVNPNHAEVIVDTATQEGPGKKLVWKGEGGKYEANFTLTGMKK